ncbi:MauE/DoxX family redox-associated membrane protein [Corynebacterium sp. TAE3-ERU30]|uniref:MauE/DoxX family redox-associated membrane protein n=1 Tax=Corynebacterium sp. TAE3-ERU30 TaxID=2849496 RepID=UPI00351CDCA8
MTTTQHQPAPRRGIQGLISTPLVGALARLALAGIWIVSGATKISDPVASSQAVHAYELVSWEMGNFIGVALPAVELILGIMLLSGLFLRPAAALSALLFAVFIIGIASAWARGLSIDCGCFGGGGVDASVTGTTYALEILRDLAFIALAAIVWINPFRRWALYP